MKTIPLFLLNSLILLNCSSVQGMLRHSRRLFPRTAATIMSNPKYSCLATRLLTTDDDGYQCDETGKLICPEGNHISLVSLHKHIAFLEKQIIDLRVANENLSDELRKTDKYADWLGICRAEITGVVNEIEPLVKLNQSEITSIRLTHQVEHDDLFELVLELAKTDPFQWALCESIIQNTKNKIDERRNRSNQTLQEFRTKEQRKYKD